MTGDACCSTGRILAVSLFNTILLLWLGLTVLLNAERRTWGIWAAGGGLLLGRRLLPQPHRHPGARAGHGELGMDLWWRLGWGPVIALPFAWYVVMLWYAGFWERPAGRAAPPPAAVAGRGDRAGAGPVGAARCSPTRCRATRNWRGSTWRRRRPTGGVPLLVLAYPFYILLCIGLSLDALRHPTPAGPRDGRPGPPARPALDGRGGGARCCWSACWWRGAMAALLVDRHDRAPAGRGYDAGRGGGVRPARGDADRGGGRAAGAGRGLLRDLHR